jgi:hypothetical protein
MGLPQVELTSYLYKFPMKSGFRDWRSFGDDVLRCHT